MIVQLIASAALGFGAWMGLFALFRPTWVAGITGLQARADHPEGVSEFRATLGGMFFLGHLASLVCLWMLDQMIAPVITIPLGVSWIGSGLGRVVSILKDEGAATRQNWIWVGFEIGLGLLILLPFIAMLKLVYFLG
jgi:hypothetical protein